MMDIKKGDTIYTPRFCTVHIEEVFTSEAEARKQGYYEPTHYENPCYNIFGKHTGVNLMKFAAIEK